ncbi:MAG: gamma-glutamyl-gamma-aminobutyrate hydrolase family protein [Dehalococcoidia bacterium]
MIKPRIGITRSGSAARISPSYQPYHDRIREAGGEPVDLCPAMGTPAAELIQGLDGLVLSGGPDVSPARYGQEPAPETGPVDEPRDALELGLLDAALTRDLPVLAICRGQQVLNVALGGALVQHIPGDAHRAYLEPDPRAGESRWHDVVISRGSALAELIGAGTVRTNSRHHQAVHDDALGQGLLVTARSADGIVEGLEAAGRRWLLAVQWHPERDEVAARFRPLFESFVAAAAVTPATAAGD